MERLFPEAFVEIQHVSPSEKGSVRLRSGRSFRLVEDLGVWAEALESVRRAASGILSAHGLGIMKAKRLILRVTCGDVLVSLFHRSPLYKSYEGPWRPPTIRLKPPPDPLHTGDTQPYRSGIHFY